MMQKPNTSTRLKRTFRTALPLCAITLVAFLAANTAQATPPNAPRTTAKAHVIVQFADRDLAARSITFTTPISGIRALQLSGIPFEYADFGWGLAVCNINGVGCPTANCFTCAGNNSWNYNYWNGSAWQNYTVGSDSSTISNTGAVEGWLWGDWMNPTAMHPAPPITSATNALDWLKPLQSLSHGGYGGDSGTTEAQLAIGASDYRAGEWRRQPTSPALLNYQMLFGSRYAGYGAAESGKLAAAQIATNACMTPMTRLPSSYYNAGTGAYFSGAGPHSWAMLGTVALSQTVPANAKNYLKSLVQSNGAWEWAPTWGTDTNTTALAVQALMTTGEISTSGYITNALAYFQTAQNSDGGFWSNSTYTTTSDANSTAYVIQAIIAAGQDPAAAPWIVSGNNPISFLMGMQLSDGSFKYLPGDSGSNQLATTQAIVALMGRPHPLRIASPVACSSQMFPLIIR